jgi:hypothetical protein
MGGVDNAEHSAVAEAGLILRSQVGSTAHGLHLGGTDDRDEMGVCPSGRRCRVVIC